MAHGERTEIRKLQKRGSGLCVVIPSSVIKHLGWNRDDALRLDVIDNALVVVRIDLPKMPALRSKAEAVASEQ